jgi:serine/threonine-protein kinase
VQSQAPALKKTCPRCGGTFEADAIFCPRDGTKLQPEGDPTDRSPDAYIGTVVAGDVEILSIAGRGAMGRVYRGHQRVTDRDVAVKILHRELSTNPQLVSRFHREAKIASRLSHPHVVEVFTAGQLPDGSLYIVMEYLDGQSLAEAVESAGGALDVERALPIALQISDAVGEGHTRGIVHRDLKPENVMLVRRGDVPDWVKVLDFGIARVSLGEQSMETQTGLIFGTARYISPEGAQGSTVGPPGDVYSLATMTYHMLAGRTPFDAAQPVGLLIKHIHEAPPELRSMPRAAGVPDAIARVVMENLATEPEKRAPTARAFGNALAAAAKAASIALADVGAVARLSMVDVGAAAATPLEPTLDDAAAFVAPPARAPAAAPATPRAEDSKNEPKERKRAPWLVIGLAFLLGAAIAALVTQSAIHRRDADHDAYVARAQKALAESRYVSPPGDNVRDLVAGGLAKWPNDTLLAQIRSDAAHEMVTRSMAARSAGDLEGARDLARNALALNPTDHSANSLAEQYDDEVRSLTTEPGKTSGGPIVSLASPARAKPGQSIELGAGVLPRGSGAHARVSGAKITIFDNEKTTGGRPVAVTEVGPGGASHAYTARATAPGAGSYDVVFEAAVEGRLVRAERDLDVIP